MNLFVSRFGFRHSCTPNLVSLDRRDRNRLDPTKRQMAQCARLVVLRGSPCPAGFPNKKALGFSRTEGLPLALKTTIMRMLGHIKVVSGARRLASGFPISGE